MGVGRNSRSDFLNNSKILLKYFFLKSFCQIFIECSIERAPSNPVFIECKFDQRQAPSIERRCYKVNFLAERGVRLGGDQFYCYMALRTCEPVVDMMMMMTVVM